MSGDEFAHVDPALRQAWALERIADALEILTDRDTIVQNAIRERMEPGDFYQALDANGHHRFGGVDGAYVKQEAAPEGLTVQRQWTYMTHEWRPA